MKLYSKFAIFRHVSWKKKTLQYGEISTHGLTSKAVFGKCQIRNPEERNATTIKSTEKRPNKKTVTTPLHLYIFDTCIILDVLSHV